MQNRVTTNHRECLKFLRWLGIDPSLSVSVTVRFPLGGPIVVEEERRVAVPKDDGPNGTKAP